MSEPLRFPHVGNLLDSVLSSSPLPDSRGGLDAESIRSVQVKGAALAETGAIADAANAALRARIKSEAEEARVIMIQANAVAARKNAKVVTNIMLGFAMAAGVDLFVDWWSRPPAPPSPPPPPPPAPPPASSPRRRSHRDYSLRR